MNPIRLAAGVVVVLICGAGWFVSSTDTPNLISRLSPPSSEHWAGTDHLGRDVLNRTLRAAAEAAAVALPAWVIAICFGTGVGVVAAAYSGRMISRTIDWAISLVFATPSFLALVGLGVLLGRGMGAIFVVVVLLGWAFPARHARAIARDVLGASYTRAARSMGFSGMEIARHVLAPACFRPVFVASGGLIAEILALDLALTLFGFGPQPPAPTFGTLLSDGLRFLTVAPWTALAPLAVICLICFCFRSIVPESRMALQS